MNKSKFTEKAVVHSVDTERQMASISFLVNGREVVMATLPYHFSDCSLVNISNILERHNDDIQDQIIEIIKGEKK